MKRLTSILLICALLLISLSACGEDKVLGTPQNVTLSDTGRLTWDAVENAESYTVTIGEKTYSTTKIEYQVPSMSVDFTYSVVAEAEGYTSSAPSKQGVYQVPYIPPVDTTEIAVAHW